MTESRREFFTKIAGTFIVGGAATAAMSSEARPNRIYVGIGGDFRDIKDALASISDNGAANPYQLYLLPGTFGAFDAMQFVDVCGSGVKSSIIEASGTDFIEICSNVSLSNLGIHFSGTDVPDSLRGAIQANETESATEVVLQNLEIFVDGITGCTAPRYAINFGGKVDVTAWNVRIATESCGLRLKAGFSRWHGCDIYLRGKGVGLPHYGVMIEGTNRFDFYGGRIGTGYYYDADLDDPDQDVIGVYIPASNTSGNTRAEIHDAEMFARNVTPAAGVRVNAVRAENGWVRLFGCFCQSEITPDTNGNGSSALYAAYRTPAQPEEGQGGKIEAFGCRVKPSIEGYVIGGAGIQGAVTYTAADNSAVIPVYENLILCDATDGPFNLKLGDIAGDEHIFKKIDWTLNTVTIMGNGNLIDGFDQIELTNSMQSVRVRSAGKGWYVL